MLPSTVRLQPRATRLRHGVPRVQEEIEEHLLQLVLDPVDDAIGRHQVLPHLDACALELVLEQGQHVVDDRVQVHGARVDRAGRARFSRP